MRQWHTDQSSAIITYLETFASNLFLSKYYTNNCIEKGKMEFKAAWTLPDFATHEEASNIYYYLFPENRHLSNSKPFGLPIKQNQNNTNPLHAQVWASRPPVKISVRRPSQAQSCCDPMNPSPADCPIIASASRSPVHPARGPPLSVAVASEAFGSPPQNKKKKRSNRWRSGPSNIGPWFCALISFTSSFVVFAGPRLCLDLFVVRERENVVAIKSEERDRKKKRKRKKK